MLKNYLVLYDRIMKITVLVYALILCCTGTLLAAPADGQIAIEKKISITIEKGTLGHAAEQLRQTAGIRLYFNAQLLNRYHVEQKTYRQISVRQLLTDLLPRRELTFDEREDAVIIRPLNEKEKAAQAKPGRIAGKILDEKGQPLPGASIKVTETGQGLQSSIDGSYALSLPPGAYTLEFSFLSYQTQRVTGVVVTEEQVTPLNISLKPTNNNLNEVRVTATYKKASVEGLYARQKAAPGLTDGISAEQI